MPLAEIVIRNVQRDRCLKVFNFFAECVCQPSEPAAVHPQRVILFLNVRCSNRRHVRRAANGRPFDFYDFCLAIPDGVVFCSFLSVTHGKQIRLFALLSNINVLTKILSTVRYSHFKLRHYRKSLPLYIGPRMTHFVRT